MIFSKEKLKNGFQGNVLANFVKDKYHKQDYLSSENQRYISFPNI